MEEQRFDDLTRLVAGKTSRRQVLKVLVGAALGGWFVGSDGGRVWASSPNCPSFCEQVFGRDTAATTQCIQDAKAGKGLCSTCGPASPGGGVASSAVCCTRNSSGHCTSYSGATCCGSTQVCSGGVCVTCGEQMRPCCAGGSCGMGAFGRPLTCCNGICGECCSDADCAGSPVGPTCCYATTVGGLCTDTASDFCNCGACGNLCPGGTDTEQCANGVCVATYPRDCSRLSNCNGNGICDSLTGTCQCQGDWVGEDCGTYIGPPIPPTCQSDSDCPTSQVCTGGTCGPAQPCYNGGTYCNGNGICVRNACQCAQPYTGQVCDQDNICRCYPPGISCVTPYQCCSNVCGPDGTCQ